VRGGRFEAAAHLELCRVTSPVNVNATVALESR
jgi:hypothetical protein